MNFIGISLVKGLKSEMLVVLNVGAIFLFLQKIEVTGFSSLHEISDCFSKISFDFTFFSALQDYSARL